MGHFSLKGVLRILATSVVAILCGYVSLAQSGAPVTENAATSAKAASDLLNKLDQLVEKNQELEKQNQELVNQINELRQFLAQQTSASPTSSKDGSTASANSMAAQQNTAKQQNAQQNGQASTLDQDNDDKTRLPQASPGNPAIFGEFNPGRGFTVGKGEYGELNLSGYMAVRYLNQLPADQSATDHLGRPVPIDPRQDFQFHRVMLFSQGWLFSPKFLYSTFLWTVQDTNQVAVGGALYYNFGKFMDLGAGWNAYPGTMSLQGSHPYWLSYDRVMADEFFRPYFSQGVFAKGNILPRLEYRWMVGNNNSNLDVPAIKLDRDLSAGFAMTWLPTTGEFGPRGAFGDYESHEQLATRFNLAYTYSPENRQASIGSPASNTTLRLSDSLNIFDPGAFAQGVTVEKARYQLLSGSAGIKYHGLFLQGEGYGRKLDNFVADGPLPVGGVRDYGFYVQLGYMVVPKTIELYGATSYIFGQYGHPKEFIIGGNYYPWNTRNARLNIQLINVDHSPVSSTFGFYLGQLTGQVFTIGVTGFY
jgi:DNA-binding protein H-NS